MAQGCANINNNNVGNGGTHATICFFNSSGVSMGACLDCQLTGSGWKCGSQFNAYVNYYSATVSGVPCYNAVSLPVELAGFSARQEDREVWLEWTTLSEQNSDYFEVLKIDSSGETKVLGKVEAAGNSSTPIRYEFRDNAPFDGNNYYLLRQVDFNGESKLYDIISLVFENDEQIVFYPNPITDNTIQWSNGNTVESIEIYTAEGKLIDVVQGDPIAAYTFEGKMHPFYLFRVLYKDQTSGYFKIERH